MQDKFLVLELTFFVLQLNNLNQISDEKNFSNFKAAGNLSINRKENKTLI